MQNVLNRLGFALCGVAFVICAVLHLATFFTIISLLWVLPPFFIMAGAVLCSRAVQPRLRLPVRMDRVTLVGFGLLAYAILTFIYFYKTTGGASSVAIVDGQYVSQYKSHIIRVITKEEYRMFPNLWARVMTAWVGMMAVFCTKSFTLPRWLSTEVSPER